MKTLLTIVFVTLLSSAYGQTYEPMKKSNFFATNGNWEELSRIKNGSDTLEILSPKIKYIKIDGKVYQIVRKVEIVESLPEIYFDKNGYYLPTTDTLTMLKFYQNKLKYKQ
jgi:hypothetical protein